MIKRFFEILSLSILAVLGLAKLKGKRVNPPALRALLAIISFMAICLDSRIVLLFSGTWLVFLLFGDVSKKFGFDMRLFVPVPAEGAPSVYSAEITDESADSSTSTKSNTKYKQYLNKCASSVKSFLKGK